MKLGDHSLDEHKGTQKQEAIQLILFFFFFVQLAP